MTDGARPAWKASSVWFHPLACRKRLTSCIRDLLIDSPTRDALPRVGSMVEEVLRKVNSELENKAPGVRRRPRPPSGSSPATASSLVTPPLQQGHPKTRLDSRPPSLLRKTLRGPTLPPLRRSQKTGSQEGCYLTSRPLRPPLRRRDGLQPLARRRTPPHSWGRRATPRLS